MNYVRRHWKVSKGGNPNFTIFAKLKDEVFVGLMINVRNVWTNIQKIDFNIVFEKLNKFLVYASYQLKIMVYQVEIFLCLSLFSGGK
jgi:hypothetical protein